MSTVRFIVFVTAALATGLAAGAVLTDRITDALSTTPQAAPGPVEAPLRGAKEARLDAGCRGQTWPYISGPCLERVAAHRPVGAQPASASRDLANRTTTLTKPEVLRTASR